MGLFDIFKRKNKVTIDAFFNSNNSICDDNTTTHGKLNEVISSNAVLNDMENVEHSTVQRRYVRIKDENKVYTEGVYKIGTDIQPGEYYFWGDDIWYIKKKNKEEESLEYKRDSYDYLKKGEKLIMEEGSFTSIDNIEYLWKKNERLMPGHVYRVGLEIPAGSYWLKYIPAYVYMDDEEETENNCVFDMHKDYTAGMYQRVYAKSESHYITDEEVYIQIRNGSALFISEDKFEEEAIVENAEIEENLFFKEGNVVYETDFLNVKIYKKFTNVARITGEYPLDIKHYYIYSVDDVLKWKAKIYPLSTESLHTITFSFCEKNNRNNRFETRISNFGLSFEKDLREWVHKVEVILPNNLSGCELIIEMSECNGKKVKGELKEYKNADVGEYNREEYKEEFEKLRKLLIDYKELDAEKELTYFEKYPHYLIFVNQCLQMVKDAQHTYSNKKGLEEKIISFKVNIDYSKFYYCASKIADTAVSVSKDRESYVVDFKGNQINEIEVMSYLFYDSEKENDVLIRKYLSEYSYLYYAWDYIQSAIDTFNHENGYSSVITNSVLVRVIKVIKKRLQKRVDCIYSEIAKEGRVQSKWGNEYLLFMIISKYVKNVQYQYHCSWLRQQSFDIYLEDYHYAVEYQGKQHYEPISIFGGEEGLERTKERDRRKRKLAEENGVKVLDWMYTIPVNEESVCKFLSDNEITILEEPRDKEIRSVKDGMAPIVVKEKKVSNAAPRKKAERVIKNYIVQYSLDGEMIKKFNTLKDAAEGTGIVTTSIAKVIRGERNSAGGYVWRKYDVENAIPTNIEILFDISLINSGKPTRVARINSDGEIIEEYDSITQAAKMYNTQQKTINSKIQKGIEWKYID